MKSSEARDIICLNHKEDIIAVHGQCDYCHKLMKSKDWLDELKQCKTCKKNICQNCREDGCHFECEEEKRIEMAKKRAYETEWFCYYDAKEDGYYYFESEKAYNRWRIWLKEPWNREYEQVRSYDYKVFEEDGNDRDYEDYNWITKYCDERVNMEFVSDGFNAHLMDYDFIKSADISRKNKNFGKKSSRKRMKNKKKYGSCQKRQLDKRGNNKRSKRRREISNIIKNEMLNL